MERPSAFAPERLRLIGFAVLASVLTACRFGADDPVATASLMVAPPTIALGQSATLTWSSSSGTTCTAGGGWTGTQQGTGTLDVTPTATGAINYTLTCSGGGYRSGATQSATLTVNAASAYTTTSLVEDLAGGAARTSDPLLVNPWGLAYGPTSAIWAANNHSETSTIYDGSGRPSPLIVHLPPGPGAAPFDATGIVFNASADFVVSNATQSGPALFIFDGEDGRIAGWALTVDAANAIAMYSATDGAVYKGLAIASNGTANFLYATDFANDKIDVLDATFAKQAPTAASFAFADPTLPAGYGPFGIQAITNGAGTTRLYVSYAKHDTAEPDDDAPGPGLGLVNVFDTNGHLVEHLIVEGGKLNAPWGLALAPADFGTLSGALLVGNFGDGTIHGYDPDTGRYLGEIGDGTGTPFALPGLWGIAFGNDAVNQPHATLFYAAGTNGEVNGQYGRIDLGSTPPALGAAPVVTLSTPAGDLSGTVALEADVTDAVAVSRVQFFANGGTPIGAATAAPFAVPWDTRAVQNGSVTLRAIATDENGNVGSSRLVTVNVANAPAAVTLTELQQSVFTPRCASCHDGSQPAGGSLPGAMDLRPGHTFASLVSVTSLEQPTLQRVKPGEPDSSYVTEKLAGTPGIAGARMPFGGPFLDQATIDEVRSWIASGAPND